MKISIVMAYFNRKEQLKNTINSIKKSEFKDFELIIVDDGSSLEHRAELVMENDPDINYNITYIDPEQKWWSNPCIPFNIGFKKATGDVIILQNPECYHSGDILSYINDNISYTDYLTFSCYSLSREETIDTHMKNSRCANFDGDSGWYNHPIYRPSGYHFCSAIYKTHLDELNGFDERYAMGIGYDDNELLVRIHRKGLRISIIENPIVYHQWHYSSSNSKKNSQDNAQIYRNLTLKEETWRVNNR